MKAHIVARTYLKGFAKTQGVSKGVVVYDRRLSIERQVREQTTTDVKRVAVVDDFYVLQLKSGPDDSIEAGLSEIESGWGALRTALRAGKLGEKEWWTVVLYAAAQEARSPRNRLLLATTLDEQLSVIEREGKARGLSEERIAEWRAGCIERHEKAAEGDAILDASSLSLASLPAFTRQNLAFFNSMNRALVKSVLADFVTSDHPVIWFDPRNYNGNPCPNKLSLSAEVTFPLDRRHAVVFSYMPIADADASESLASVINARTAAYALEQTYAFPALGEADKARHLRLLTDFALAKEALVERLLDDDGKAVDLVALTKLIAGDESEVMRELLIEGNRHLAPEAQLQAAFERRDADR